MGFSFPLFLVGEESMGTEIITIAVIAWISQIFLGWYQLKSFNGMFDKLCEQGKIGVGRSMGSRFSFKPRVIIALAIDENEKVISAIIMKGLTVFARPQQLQAICGFHIQSIDPKKIFPNHQTCQEALFCAITLKD